MCPPRRIGATSDRAAASSACGPVGKPAIGRTRKLRSTSTCVSRLLPKTSLSLLHPEWKNPWQQWSAWPRIAARSARRGRRLLNARCLYRSRAPGLVRTGRAKDCGTFSHDSICPTLQMGSPCKTKEHDSGQRSNRNASSMSDGGWAVSGERNRTRNDTSA